MRCFVAITLDDPVRREVCRTLETCGRAGGKDVRWCLPEQLHVTLKFLGQVADDLLPAVTQILQSAAAKTSPFDLELGGLGGFPSRRSPRVLWCAATDAAGGCARWLELADPPLAQLGFDIEQRRFTPHITLARSRSPAGSLALRRILETASPPAPRLLPVRDITLFESRPRPAGAIYVPHARFSFDDSQGNGGKANAPIA